MSEIKDYLHLYLGCEVVFDNEKYLGNPEKLTIEVLHNIDYGNLYNNVKPILRNLSSMTEGEIIKTHDHFYPDHADSSRNHKLNFMALVTGEKQYKPEHTVWFLKLGIDLFNLHEQGLCLYKSDL